MGNVCCVLDGSDKYRCDRQEFVKHFGNCDRVRSSSNGNAMGFPVNQVQCCGVPVVANSDVFT